MGMSGSELLVRQLLAHDVRDFFHVVGGPMNGSIIGSIEAGIRGIGVRDERGGTYAAIAYSRVTQRPAVVMACSGPGTINTVPGVAQAYADGAPVIVVGGASPIYPFRPGAFQETDQVGVMRPITKWAHKVGTTDSLPEAVARAFAVATSGAPGPVYLDLPEDVLYRDAVRVDASSAVVTPRPRVRAAGEATSIAAAIDLLAAAARPVIVAGSGVLWSQAWEQLRAFVEVAGVPFYTTPMTSGLLPEDHALSFPAARSTALREADCLFVIGTRDNYVLNFLEPPVISGDSKIVELNINAGDLSVNRLADVAILADAKVGLSQLTDEAGGRPQRFAFDEWTQRLGELDAKAKVRNAADAATDEVPIHPLRIAAEIRVRAPREARLVVDGRETLTFGRRVMPAYVPAGMLNPGTYGAMGVGVPYALGAKVAAPATPVVLFIGDGAFGYHIAELETAVRHSIGFVCVVGNNGSWTGYREKPGHALSYSDYERSAELFGCWGTRVEDPGALGPTLQEAFEYVARESKPAVVNVIMSTAKATSRPRNFKRETRKDTSDIES